MTRGATVHCITIALLGIAHLPAQTALQLHDKPLLREIGPANMSGRIVDIAVDPGRPATWFVASASGGLFRTKNAGTTFEPVWDRAATVSIGAVAVSPKDPKVVWIGSGEANARNSVSWGNGVYLSKDGGDTWAHVGLAESFQIGAIAAHPSDANTAFVAACGKLWGRNPGRGLYRTKNTGKTWQKVLEVDSATGAIDVLIDAKTPARMWAATWPRLRDAFDGNAPVERWGKGGGIWRSEDGGTTWRRVTLGLPTCAIGRVGLTQCTSQPDVLYAIVESARIGWQSGSKNANAKGKKLPFGTRLGGQAPNIQDQQGNDGHECGGIYRSDDGGKSWRRVNSLNPRPFYYSQVRVDPEDPERVYVLGVTYWESTDGGKSFDKAPHTLHPDFHALWIDPKNPEHMLIGCDGGLAESYDRGQNWRAFHNLPCGQVYRVRVDDKRPYRIYAGYQDNGSWTVPSRTRFEEGLWTADARNLGWGDGFTVMPHPVIEDRVYYSWQFGSIRWRLLDGLAQGGVPKAKASSGKAMRYNWDTPYAFAQKTHDLWYAGNQVVRVRANKAEVVSPDLALDDRGSATELEFSPKKRGVVWVGTDDGALWLSKNDGKAWRRVDSKLHELAGGARYVSAICAASTSSSAAVVALDGHRQDDFGVHLYETKNSGKTWKRLGKGIDKGPIHCVEEGAHNPSLLFAGTEFGLWFSIDRGKTWNKLPGLPTVAVRDLALQPRTRELVLGTHGRGTWILDISGLEGLTIARRRKAVALLPLPDVTRWGRRPFRIRYGDDTWRSDRPIGSARVHYWIGSKQKAAHKITVWDSKNKQVASFETALAPGLHRVDWNLRRSGRRRGPRRPLPAGRYELRLSEGKKVDKQRFSIHDDPLTSSARRSPR